MNVILVPCTRVLLSFSFHLYKFCTYPWYQTLYVKLCIVAQCVFPCVNYVKESAEICNKSVYRYASRHASRYRYLSLYRLLQ
jgi:hypothetical protein